MNLAAWRELCASLVTALASVQISVVWRRIFSPANFAF
jgi:hypothetical protein